MSLSICPWKYDNLWVYSITYDEALVELNRFAIPYHEQFRIPGHVEAVAGHIGQVRQIGQSSYNGFHHMDGAELKDLIARGWGVGNHSWSHEIITPETVEQEVGQAKEVLEHRSSYFARPATIPIWPTTCSTPAVATTIWAP